MADLKPCPFCGGEAKVCDDIEYTVGGYWIECKDCHIQTPSKINGKEAVINYWNTRKPMEAVVAELEKYMKASEKDYVLFQLTSALGEMRAFEKAIEIVRGKE